MWPRSECAASKPPAPIIGLSKTTGLSQIDEMSKGNGKRKGIIINLDNCGYGIVHRRAKALGWHIAKKGENWDVAWSDTNSVLKELNEDKQKLQETGHASLMLSPLRDLQTELVVLYF